MHDQYTVYMYVYVVLFLACHSHQQCCQSIDVFTLFSISFPEATILLVSNGDRGLWPGPTLEVCDSRTSHHSVHARRVKSDKSDWFWSQSIVFTKPFKTLMSLDLARGPDFQCMTKGTPGDEVALFYLFLNSCIP